MRMRNRVRRTFFIIINNVKIVLLLHIFDHLHDDDTGSESYDTCEKSVHQSMDSDSFSLHQARISIFCDFSRGWEFFREHFILGRMSLFLESTFCWSRTKGCYIHSVFAPLLSNPFWEGKDIVFRREIDGHEGAGLECCSWCHIEYFSWLSENHIFPEEIRELSQGRDIERYHLRVFFEISRVKVSKISESSIIDEDIDDEIFRRYCSIQFPSTSCYW